MNVRFILRSSAFLLPLILLFVVSARFWIPAGDYQFHLTYQGNGNYPPGLAYIMAALSFLMPRATALLLIAIVVILFLPYVLIFEITREEKASWIYLYGSGVPLVLLYVWIIPQAIIHVFALASLRWRWFIPIFLVAGWLFHFTWIYAVFLVIAYRLIGGKCVR